MIRQSAILKAMLAALILSTGFLLAGPQPAQAAEKKALNVLFIGNSFTGRHNLTSLVKGMAEAGDPDLSFEVTTVIYGGRTLKDHWRLGTQNFVKLSTLSRDEEQATIASLEAMAKKDPKDKYAPSALVRHRGLLKTLDKPHKRWDIVVLQSYRDDAGAKSPYAEYAPKFAELIHAQGARVVLYETTPVTQNEKPLSAPPDHAPVLAKVRAIAALAKRIDATVVPMAMVALHCQTVRPDLTLRFVNDGHLNQTMAYLTACTFYGVLFGRSPEGRPLDKVTDTRPLDGDKGKDRDGGPITRTFAPKERAELQRIAWEGLKQFDELARSTPKD